MVGLLYYYCIIARLCFWLKNGPYGGFLPTRPGLKYGIFPGMAMDGLVYFEILKKRKQMRIAALLGWLYVCFWGVVACI